MTRTCVKKIAIFGNDIAGVFCAAKLAQILPDNIELTYIEATETSHSEALWGSVTSPASYDFLLGLGITEPDILPYSNTSFSLGTQYKNWGPDNRNWTQSFHRPLPAYNGVGFHHYLTRLSQESSEFSNIEPYIMSVQAALSGVFAHPPEGKKIPLADVEYGYHFAPDAWRTIISTKLKSSSMQWIQADISKAIWSDGSLASVALSNGQTITADFFIDALGTQSKLALPSPETQSRGRRLKAKRSFIPKDNLNSVCRIVTGTDYGWTSETPLQNGTQVLSVFDPKSETEAEAEHETSGHTTFDVTLGRLTAPWHGNILTLGHGAARLEPLTPAPIILLQRDIERLAELIPVTDKMDVESREYNRRFNADYEHAALFQNAFFKTPSEIKSPYFKTAANELTDPKLLDKVDQFKSRGVFVQYDYEPFNEQDWTMLHLGMGRQPARYDPLASHIPEDQLKNTLSQMRTAIAMMAKKMPPHHIYMTGLLKYLKEKHG